MASRKRVRKACAIDDSASLSTVNVVRRRSGKLTLLPDLPYDIVVEILGHLHPYDLLRLTRTSKDWRRSLMSRSSESIWRLARSRLSMPDCPSDMSEPEYANLMFSTHCHYCLAPRVQPVIWTTRCRACKACFPIYYTRSLTVRWKKEHCDLPLQAWRFTELHGNIVRSSTYAPITSRDKFRNIISLELLEDLTEEFKQIKDEPDSIQHWLQKREEEHEHETRIAGALEQWHERQRQRRSQEIESIREKRKDMVVQKLEEIGWKEEIAAMDIERLRSQARVHVARELTESAWVNMAPALIQFMEGVKAERLQKLRDEQISSRRQLFSDYMMEVQIEVSTTIPGFIFVVPSTDLSQAPSIRAIIEGTPVDQTITPDAFIPVRDQLRKLSFGWSVYQSLELLKVLPPNVADDLSNNQPSRLFLATTFFRCERIRDPISYPEILTHPGMSSYFPYAGVLKPEEKRLFEDFRQEFWNRNQSRVSFHEPAARAAQSIIETCNLDPAVTTAKDMDTLNPFIGCASCRNPSNPLNDTLIMTWRRAVIHALEHKSQNTVPLWVLLHANIQADWYNEALSSVQKEGPIYRCHLCTEYGDSSFIWVHFASRHRPLIPRRLHLLADPPSAFWVPSPITNALGALGPY